MTYAYIIVIYITYIQIYYYITIVFLAMGCQKTCGGRFLYIKIFLATVLLYYKCLLAFDEHVHLPCNSQV